MIGVRVRGPRVCSLTAQGRAREARELKAQYDSSAQSSSDKLPR